MTDVFSSIEDRIENNFKTWQFNLILSKTQFSWIFSNHSFALQFLGAALIVAKQRDNVKIKSVHNIFCELLRYIFELNKFSCVKSSLLSRIVTSSPRPSLWNRRQQKTKIFTTKKLWHDEWLFLQLPDFSFSILI